jgi:hypothetical protein
MELFIFTGNTGNILGIPKSDFSRFYVNNISNTGRLLKSDFGIPVYFQ